MTTSIVASQLAAVLLQIEQADAPTITKYFEDARISVEASGHPNQAQALSHLEELAASYQIEILK